MTNEEFIENVLTTENKDYEGIARRLSNPLILRLMHASDIIHTESGELKDQLKKHVYYGKTLDQVNIKEELGDLLYGVGLAIHVCGLTFEEVMEFNSKKLKSRYGDKWSKEKAINRDLNKERNILEGKK